MQPAYEPATPGPIASAPEEMNSEPAGSSRELPQPQQIVIAALATGVPVAEAARRAGVHRSTVHTWLNKDPHFAAELNRRKLEHTQRPRAGVQALSDQALSAIRNILTRDGVPEGVRLRAAITILNGAGAFREIHSGPTEPREVADSWFLGKMQEEFPKLF